MRGTRVHYIERCGLGLKLVENIDLVHFAVADMDKCRDIAAQIEQCMQLMAALCGESKLALGGGSI